MGTAAQINRDSAIPVYVQVVNWLTSQIVTGKWQPGHQLKSEPDLANELGISRGSLRKAIGLLVSKGMLQQVQGRGTFVQDALLEQTWAGRLVSMSEELTWQGIPFTTEVLAQEICDPPEHRIASILRLAPDGKVLHLLRRRFIDDEPIAVHQTFFPANQFAELVSVDFTTRTMVTDILERQYGLRLSRADHTIAAISADRRTSEWLGVNAGEPVIYDEHVLYDDSDNRIEFTKGWFRGDRMRLKTVVYRESPPDVPPDRRQPGSRATD
jgi:DNA-binding GntR family transcriptional regulator